jgi:hypothetical protein
MAKYLLLIYGDDEQWSAMTPEQSAKHDAAHRAFTAAAGSRILGAEELELAPAAVTMRAGGNGEVLTVDGPFAETKEAVGGYYLLEADHIDEVTALVALLPEVHAGHSGVEIRPVVDHS